MSLIDNGACSTLTIPNNYCFSNLFRSCNSLLSPPALPATTLTGACYQDLFMGCTSLLTAPKLPATTLAASCYNYLFYCCTSLTIPPALPATTLAMSCYEYMFYGCTSLTTIPALPANELVDYCYNCMFSSCTALEVNDAAVSGVAEHEWKIPTAGTFTNTTSYPQYSMFYNCAKSGSRSSDTISGATGESHTYYTQNAPV